MSHKYLLFLFLLLSIALIVIQLNIHPKTFTQLTYTPDQYRAYPTIPQPSPTPLPPQYVLKKGDFILTSFPYQFPVVKIGNSLYFPTKSENTTPNISQYNLNTQKLSTIYVEPSEPSPLAGLANLKVISGKLYILFGAYMEGKVVVYNPSIQQSTVIFNGQYPELYKEGGQYWLLSSFGDAGCFSQKINHLNPDNNKVTFITEIEGCFGEGTSSLGIDSQGRWIIADHIINPSISPIPEYPEPQDLILNRIYAVDPNDPTKQTLLFTHTDLPVKVNNALLYKNELFAYSDTLFYRLKNNSSSASKLDTPIFKSSQLETDNLGQLCLVSTDDKEYIFDNLTSTFKIGACQHKDYSLRQNWLNENSKILPAGYEYILTN